MSVSFRTPFAVIALALLTGCPQTSGAQLALLSITPDNARVAKGERVQFVATGLYTDNSLKVVTGEVTWSIDDAFVGSMSADTPGLAQALNEGTTTIRAKLDGVTTQRAFVVAGAGIARLEIDPNAPVVPVGLSLQLRVTAISTDNTASDVSTDCMWSTSASIITLDANTGLVKGLAPGEATVTVTHRGVVGRATLIVSDASIRSLSLSPYNPMLPKGITQAITATAQLSDNSSLDVTGQALWSSTDADTVFVSNLAGENGLILGRKVGAASITARLGSASASTPVTVTDAELSRLEVAPMLLKIANGTTGQLTATGFFSDGTRFEVSSAVSWSAVDPKVVHVSSKGAVSGLTLGQTGITAAMRSLSTSAQVIVSGATLDALSVMPSPMVVPKGTSLEAVLVGSYSDTTTQVLTSQALWSSSDVTIATVSNAAGKAGTVTGLKPGTATLEAQVAGLKITVPVTVSAAALTELQMGPSVASLPKGTTQHFVVTGLFSDGTSADLTQQVTWASDAPSVAAVSNVAPSRGLVVASSTGTALLTASLGPLSVTAEVTVTSAALKTISLTPQPVTLAVGTSQVLTATGVYTDDSTRNLSAQATWGSSDSSVAFVSNVAGHEGEVLALKAGTTEVSAQFGTTVGRMTVTVTPAQLAEITVSSPSTSIAAGLTQAFTARGRFTDNTVQDLTEQLTWVSSMPSIASVSNVAGFKGLVTARVAGSTRVRASNATLSGFLDVTVAPAVVTDIVVTPSSPSLAKGTSTVLKAWATLSDARSIDVSTQVTWSSLDSQVASVSNVGGREGEVLAQRLGATSIQAKLAGKTGSASVQVTAATLSFLDITPASPSVPLGVGVDFVATGTYSDGSTQNLTAQVTWSSSAESVAVVSNVADSTKGHATTLAVGTSRIGASFDGVSARVDFEVTSAVLSSLEVVPVTARIAALTTVRFQATGIYTDGSTQDLSSQVSWSSANGTVATIDPVTGKASALAAGVADIIATKAAFTGHATLTVTSASLVQIELSPAAPSAPAGHSRQLVASGIFSDGSTQDLTEQAAWSTSSGTLATVANGLVRAVSVGTPLISASALSQVGSITFTVTDALLEEIDVSPASTGVPKGLTRAFTASGRFSDGSSSDITTQVTWSTDAALVAPVSNADGSRGMVTALTLGTATITASLSGKTDTGRITVTDAELVRVDLTPTNPSLAAGLSTTLTATGTYTDATTQDLSSRATWSSSLEASATVSNASGSKGFVRAVAAGDATIEASVDGQTASTVVHVNPAELVSIGLSPATPQIPRGLSAPLTATGTYTDGSQQDLTSMATWSTDAATIASVSNGSTRGQVTAVNPGEASISAAYSGKTGTTVVTVTPATLQQIQVNPPGPSVAAGLQQPLTATGIYSDSSTLDLTAQVTWSSDDTVTATVSNTVGNEGRVTGKVAGSTAIRATKALVSGFVTFTVTPAVLQQIQVTPANTSVPKGLAVQFVAMGLFSNGTSLDVSTQVTWSTDDGTTVSISNAGGSIGLASTLNVGAVTVSAQLGSIVGTTPLTVNPAVMTALSISPASVNLPLGTVRGFTATATYTDGSTQLVTTPATWGSTDATVVDVSNGSGSHGLATTFKVGEADVTASYGGFNATAHVTVTQATLASIDLTPFGGSTPLGFTRQFIAIGTYSDSTTQVLTNLALWESSDVGRALISNALNSKGLMSTVSTGAVTITATYQGVTGTSLHTVSSAVLTSLEVTPASFSVAQGATRQLTAIGTFSDATTQDLTTSATWASGSGAVAQVSNAPSTKGLVTGIAPGSVTVTATSGAIVGQSSATVP